MGNTNPAAKEDAPEKLTPPAGSEAEPGTNGSAPTKNEDGTPSDDGSSTREDGEDDGEDSDEDDKPETTPEGEPKDEDDDDEEPPVRPKSPASFAKQRIANKAAKDGAKAEKKGGSADEEDDDDLDNDDGDKKSDIDERVNRAVAEALRPQREQQEKQETEQSVNTFLTDPKNKLFAPFKAKILRFAQHESRRNIPVSSIAWEVAGPKLLAMGAQMEKAASKKAAASKTAGGSPGGQGSGKTGVMAMTTEQFKEHQRNVLNKRPAGQ